MKKNMYFGLIAAVCVSSFSVGMPAQGVCAAPAASVSEGNVEESGSVEDYTGWKQVKKKKYYYKKGVMQKNKWVKIDGKKYHFSKKGTLDVRKWVGKRYVDKKGAWIKAAVKGRWEGARYRKTNGSYLSNGEYYIDGYYYIFKDGIVQKDGWKLLDKVWYYCNAKGRVLTNRWVKATFTKVATSDWWKTFDASMPYKWVNDRGKFDARKSKTVAWEENLIVRRTSVAPEGVVREGWYWVEPLDKKKPAYYQWVKLSGNSTEDYREINRVTKKIKLPFGEGDTKNPWCIQLRNCKLTRIE